MGGFIMVSFEPEKLFTLIPDFEKGSQTAARAIHNAALGNKGVRKLADAFHGTWLGHPLHPALTDFVIGAWAMGSVLDGVGLIHRSRRCEKAADFLILLGNALSLPTAIAGLADFSTAPKRSMATGGAHALLNVGGLALNLVSSLHRRAGRRRSGRCLSATASGALFVSAWLGGKLVYQQKVGINKMPQAKAIDDWKAAMPEADLIEGAAKRAEVQGNPILLHRSGSQIHAIGSVCGHEGGPLEQGHIEGPHVTCPWHQSVFNLRDGRVIHGPSTYPEPSYDTRIQNGSIEVK
jgi:nitrite reductase/ring-hydroxylating ferredoxin subunit/uncharacterized membrane protein